MTKFKEYIADQMIGKTLHFKCGCLFPLDKSGTIRDWEIINNEIIFLIDVGGKIIRLGENHPNLYVE